MDVHINDNSGKRSLFATVGTTPRHPGELLRQKIASYGLTNKKFAAHIGVSQSAVQHIIDERRQISIAMALRLGIAFDVSPQYWLDAQLAYQIYQTRRKMGNTLKGIVQLVRAAPNAKTSQE